MTPARRPSVHGWVGHGRNGQFDKAFRTFDAAMTAASSETELMVAWRGTKWKTGALRRIEERRVWEHAGNTVVDLICQFESERLDVRVVLDPANRVIGFWIQPPT